MQVVGGEHDVLTQSNQCGCILKTEQDGGGGGLSSKWVWLL